MDVDDQELEAGEIADSPDFSNNYEVVDMDIDSSENESTEDEAQRLRQILLEQMAKNRAKPKATKNFTQSKNILEKNVPESPKSPPPTSRATPTLLSTPKTLQSPTNGPSFLPPSLSPPGFHLNFLPPPPAPPTFSSRTAAYADESYNPEAQLEDTPRSPDNLLALSLLIQSDDDAFSEDDEIEDELDLEEAKRESRERRKEIDRLLRRQRLNDEACTTLRREINITKRELADMEARLDDLMETSITLNARIQSHFEKQQNVDAKHVVRLGLERSSLKSKINTTRAGNRLKLQNLKQQVREAIIDQQVATSTLKTQNVLPQAQSHVQSFQDPPTIHTETPVLNIFKRLSSKWSLTSDSLGLNKGQQNSTTQIPLQSSTSNPQIQLDVQQIIGDSKSNHEAEQTLRLRLMSKTKRKKSSDSLKEKKLTKVTLRNRAKDLVVTPESSLEDGEKTDNRSPSQLQFPSKTNDVNRGSTPIKQKSNLATGLQDKFEADISEPLNKIVAFGSNLSVPLHFTSLEEAVRNPLIGIRAYRLFPSFPFEHIEHPALTNRLKIDKPLCPFELHGICADPTCEWQHDRDIRVPAHDIVKELLEMCPSICPPSVNKNQLALKLLEMNSVDYVARLLSAAVTDEQRNEIFAHEIQKNLVQRV